MNDKHAETNACDSISRRKAFEYFVTLWECIGTIMDRDEWEDVCMTTANEIPSAQPEIIRCKDCKYYKTKFCALDTWTNEITIYNAQPDDFCSKAERETNE